MAPPYVTNDLNAVISSTDINSSAVIINRSVGNPAIPATVGDYVQNLPLKEGANIISDGSNSDSVLGSAQVYIKNVDKTGSFVVNWFPTGVAVVNVLTMYPGDILIFWQNIDTAQHAAT